MKLTARHINDIKELRGDKILNEYTNIMQFEYDINFMTVIQRENSHVLLIQLIDTWDNETFYHSIVLSDDEINQFKKETKNQSGIICFIIDNSLFS